MRRTWIHDSITELPFLFLNFLPSDFLFPETNKCPSLYVMTTPKDQKMNPMRRKAKDYGSAINMVLQQYQYFPFPALCHNLKHPNATINSDWKGRARKEKAVDCASQTTEGFQLHQAWLRGEKKVLLSFQKFIL